MKRFSFLSGILSSLLCVGFSLFVTNPVSSAEKFFPQVQFISELANPNDFSLFANGGWDGNWFVGYSTVWVEKLKLPQRSPQDRIFVGAKLGRMKSVVLEGKSPWEKTAVPGEVWVAVSATARWNMENAYKLTDSAQIPLEGDAQNAVEGVGESQWFWVEVGTASIQENADHFIALFSPTKEWQTAAESPILAAGWGNKDVNSWLVNDASGKPPEPTKALQTAITLFEPAIAFKVVPSHDLPDLPQVKIVNITESKKIGKYPAPKVVESQSNGGAILRSWVEISTDGKKFTPFGRFIYSAPFVFTLKVQDLPIGEGGKTWVRVGVRDLYERSSYSSAQNIFE